MAYNIDNDLDCASTISKLHRISEKVHEDLQEPLFVTKQIIYNFKIALVVNFSL